MKLKKSVQFVLFGFMFSLGILGVFGKDYFVSSSGDDKNPGSKDKPWKTLCRVSEAELSPGDKLLLETGSIFQGTLEISWRGSKDQPIVVTSLGEGRATIAGGNERATSITGASFITIENLNLVGSGRKDGNINSGLFISDSDQVSVKNIEVSGFQKSGIAISGSRNVRITHVHAHNNGFAGISSEGEISHNVYVGYCLAENNPGDPTRLNNHSGNGIVLGQVKGAVIEYCEARFNGWDMPRKGNGPVGIWVWHADRAVIQFNVSHHNRSPDKDGGGFDFDGGVTNSILQYNYSHNNFGSGYLICQFYGADLFRNNTVRYNISLDDGLSNHNAGIYVWVGGSGMESTDVYNNTIVNNKGSAVSFGSDPGFENEYPEMTFRNNIFVSGKDQISGGSEKGRFEGNIYWAAGDSGFSIDGFTDFGRWVKATGQELVNRKVVGQYANPRFLINGSGLITDPAQIYLLRDYFLQKGSPAIDTGIDLRILNKTDIGKRDFYGHSLPADSRIDIGAIEMP
jgi:hypothetical protein